MNKLDDSVICSDCGADVDARNDSAGNRVACTQCGGKKRNFSDSITESVILHDGYEVKGKRPGQKKPFVEDKGVPSYSHKREKLVHHRRLIDRDNDLYREAVEDYESGEIIHHCDEPLSEHQGHGSAKYKKSSE